MNDDPKRKLGRGLSALLGEDVAGDYANLDRVRGSKDVPIALLKPNPFQPRRRWDEESLNSLVESIREKGILQPILVRRSPDDVESFEIIAGERRWRAAQKASLHQVPVIIRDLGDADSLEIALIENIQRQDLSPIEEAEGYKRLMEEFSYTQEQLAQAVGKSRSYVANSLRLLQLPVSVRGMLNDGRLSAGAARTLITAEDPEAVARRIVEAGMNVREAEALHRRSSGNRKPSRTGREKDADTQALESDITEALGLAVSIRHTGDKGGEVRISYRTLDQLDEICRRLSRQLETGDTEDAADEDELYRGVDEDLALLSDSEDSQD